MDLVIDEEPSPLWPSVPLTAQELLYPKIFTRTRGRVVMGFMSAAEGTPLVEDRWMPPGERIDRIVNLLHAAGAPLSARVISKRLSMQRRTVIEVLKRLLDENRVRRVEAWEPQWELTS